VILQQLSDAVGISGREDAVRKIILESVTPHLSDVVIDSIGNVTGRQVGTAPQPVRVMIAAHMDEVGFIVTGIESDGLLKFKAVGGMDDRILPGLRVRVGDDLLAGVILWVPIHLNQDQNVIKISNLRIDVGGSSKDEVGGKVKVGDRIAFDSRYQALSDKVVRGKAFDDRAGCALLVDVVQAGPYANDVLAAFTTQEEIGTRGAQVAVRRLQPHIALILEGTTAHDLPNPLQDPDDETATNPTTRMGHGPAITLLDASMIAHPKLRLFVQRTAEKHGIPYQFKTNPGGGTDGAVIHQAEGGIPTCVISMPCRYIHSPLALLNLDDYAHGLRLVQAVLNDITAADWA
jgi:tetrahedral aminopeptidase